MQSPGKRRGRKVGAAGAGMGGSGAGPAARALGEGAETQGAAVSAMAVMSRTHGTDDQPGSQRMWRSRNGRESQQPFKGSIPIRGVAGAPRRGGVPAPAFDSPRGRGTSRRSLKKGSCIFSQEVQGSLLRLNVGVPQGTRPCEEPCDPARILADVGEDVRSGRLSRISGGGRWGCLHAGPPAAGPARAARGALWGRWTRGAGASPGVPGSGSVAH